MSHSKKSRSVGMFNTWKRSKPNDSDVVEKISAPVSPIVERREQVKRATSQRERPPQGVPPKPNAPVTKAKGRIYLNVVIDAKTEARINRSIERHRREHGKAFGKSAWGRMAFLAQLEREGE